MEYPSLDKPKAGATRFNTDSSQLEIYDGNQWTGILATSPELQTGGTRGLTGGGQSPSNTNVINFITIASTGNATDFGDRTVSVEQLTGTSDPTRGLFAGGNPYTDVIDFVEIATTGDATDFGNLTDGRRGAAGASNGHGGR